MSNKKIEDKRLKILETMQIERFKRMNLGGIQSFEPSFDIDGSKLMVSVTHFYLNGEFEIFKKNYFDAIHVSKPDKNGSTMVSMSLICFEEGMKFLEECLFLTRARNSEISEIDSNNFSSITNFIKSDPYDYVNICNELRCDGAKFIKNSIINCLEEMIDEVFAIINKKLDTFFSRKFINICICDSASDIAFCSFGPLII